MDNCNHLIQKGNRVYGGSANKGKKFGAYVEKNVSVDTDANKYGKASGGKKIFKSKNKY
jgi:hypothetical protein